MNSGKIRHFTWCEIEDLVKDIAVRVKSDGYTPEVIVGVIRGGLVPAVYLSHLLNVRYLVPLHVSTTRDDQPYSSRTPLVVEYEDLLVKAYSKDVLLVDEVSNTGSVLLRSQELIQGFVPSALRTTVLVRSTWIHPEKEIPSHRPIIDYLGTTVNCWASFPWES